MNVIKHTKTEITIETNGYAVTRFDNGYVHVYYATKINRNNRYLPEILLYVKDGKLESSLRPWNLIPCDDAQKYIDGVTQALECVKEAKKFFEDNLSSITHRLVSSLRTAN